MEQIKYLIQNLINTSPDTQVQTFNEAIKQLVNRELNQELLIQECKNMIEGIFNGKILELMDRDKKKEAVRLVGLINVIGNSINLLETLKNLNPSDLERKFGPDNSCNLNNLIYLKYLTLYNECFPLNDGSLKYLAAQYIKENKISSSMPHKNRL